MHNRRSDDTTVNKIKALWPVLAALATIATAWGMVQTKLVYVDRDIVEVKAMNMQHTETIAKHEEALKILPEMREDIKTLLHEVRRSRRYE